jgi:hypothetical protein
MDFTKFVNLLHKPALFFSRADKLGDPFEGSFSKANINLRPTVYEGKIPQDVLRTWSKFNEILPKFTVINCWHLNEYESAALWRLYLKSNEGIAIQSTFARLRNSLKDENRDIFIGKVKYIDYEKDWLPEGNSLYPFVHKRKSFEHERELRAVIQDLPSKDGKLNLSKPLFDDGIYVSVDLNTLIDKIYLAPTCCKWLHELAKSVTKKYELDKEVLQSSLDDVPVY